MKIKEVVGIDAGKLTLECCIHTSGLQKAFDNTPQGIEDLAAWVFDSTATDKGSVLFTLEHTALYTYRLVQHLCANACLAHVVPGLEIKRSLGIARGKDDKADAKRIALYGYRVREEAEPYQMPTESLEKLKRLMSLRRKLVAQKAGHLATLGEQRRVLGTDGGKVLYRAQERIISVLDKEVKAIEKELDAIVDRDENLKNQYRLLTSIKGIGKVTARFLIVHTNGFAKFDSSRKFASYCGIAPFPHRSGTSIRGRTKVSHLANKEGKTLLSLCASTSVQHNPEMKLFYERRVEMGKNKMSTLNIIRNKLLHRAFAVVKRGTPYVDTMKYAA